MRTNTASEEGFKPNLKYQRSTSPTRKIYPWMGSHCTCQKCEKCSHSLLGRSAKIVAGLLGDEATGQGVELTRQFKKNGASASRIFKQFSAVFPEFLVHYKEVMGKDLKPDVLWDRYHKMYYDNNAERSLRGKRSDEHYLCNARLRPLVPAVEKLYRTGSITITALKELL